MCCESRLTINEVSVLYSTPTVFEAKAASCQKGRVRVSKVKKAATVAFVTQLIVATLGAQLYMVPPPALAKGSAAHNSAQCPALGAVTDEVISGKTFSVSRGVIKSSPEQVWQVLTDYDNVARVFPMVKKCQVLQEHPGKKHLKQVIAPSGGLLGNYECILEVKETAPTHMQWSRLSGAFKEIEGFWKLEPVENGRATHVTYATYVNGGFFIPQGLIRRQFRLDMPQVMHCLKATAENTTHIASKRGEQTEHGSRNQ